MEPLVPDISLVIPTYRGEARLAPLLEEIALVLAGYAYELILVDDGSGGDTAAELERMCRRYRRHRVVVLEKNRGQQEATLAGLEGCDGTILVTLDDDGAHDPADIPKLLTVLDQGFDLVFGVPLGRGGGGIRPGSRFRDRLFYRLLGAPRGVRVSSFRAFRRALLQQALREPLPGFIYLSALLLRQQPPSGSLEVFYRRGGPSRYGFRARLVLFLKLFYFYGIRRPFRG